MLKIRVIWDVDCIIADMIPAICQSIYKRYDKKYTPQQIDQWDLKVVTGIPTVQQIFDKQMILNMNPVQGSTTYLPNIWKNTYSILATYAVNDTYNQKSAWIKKHLPFVNIDNELVFIKKKYLLDGDIFIDDKAQSVIKWLQRHPNGIGFMLDYAYNREFIGTHNRLTSVKNWTELNDKINMHINFVNGCQNYITPSTGE